MLNKSLLVAVVASLAANVALAALLVVAVRAERSSHEAVYRASESLFALCALAPEIHSGMHRNEIADLGQRRSADKVTLYSDRVKIGELNFLLDASGRLLGIVPAAEPLTATHFAGE